VLLLLEAPEFIWFGGYRWCKSHTDIAATTEVALPTKLERALEAQQGKVS